MTIHLRRMFRVLLLLAITAAVPAALQAQEYDYLIDDGHVIDPRNGVDEVMDVAVADGEIAAVASRISPDDAATVIDAAGLYVTPGLVDMHVHVFHGTMDNSAYSNGYNSVPPDAFSFRAGVTTVVDAGSAGWRNFETFKEQTIDRSNTRVLAFLNIVGRGMKGDPAEQDVGDMNPRLTATKARQYPETIVGIKSAHYRYPEWVSVDRAVEAGNRAGDIPVMVDFGEFLPERPFEQLVLQHLRPGDIYTHAYRRQVPMLDESGHVRDYLSQAKERGIVFDVGHGAGSFVFRQAAPAVAQGFYPSSISTDLHAFSMNTGMKNMANLMSKFLNMGMSLQEVVARSTWRPAQYINREELGHLSEGAVADLAVFNVREGSFGFLDVEGGRLDGTRKLECELTMRGGEIVWDLNGRTRPHWKDLSPDE